MPSFVNGRLAMFEKLARLILRGKGYHVLSNDEFSKSVARAVAEALAQRNGYKPLTKEVAAEIRRGCFIPKGEYASVNASEFKPTGEYDIHRCCKPVGNDIQSGPMYCGDIAAYIAFDANGGVIGLCESHYKRLRPFESLKAA